MVSSIAPLHLLDQGNQKDVEHDSSSHMIPLVPTSVSHDADSIVNGTIAFVRLR